MNNARNLYVIRDKVANYSGPIFQARNDRDAVRQFLTALGTEGTTLHQHPADFELAQVGTQDEESGEVNAELRTVATGQLYVEMKMAQQSINASSATT